MKRVHRSLLTALVLVAVGGVGAYFVWDRELNNKQERRVAASEAKRLFRFGRDHVVRGRIFARGSTVAFQRDEEWGWKITSPVQTLGDPVAIEAAIDRMAGMRVDPVEGDLKTYELDRPEAWMEVETEAAKFKLLVGPKNQMTEQRFVTDGASSKVYLADASFVWSLDRPLEAFREHRVIPVAKDKITDITSSSPRGAEWSLKKTPEGWQVTGAGGEVLPGDAGEIDLLLVALVGRLRAKEYLSEDGRLENWKRKLEVTLANGHVFHLYLGEYSLTGATGSEVTVVWIEGTSSIIQVDDWVRKDFTKSVADLRDRTISKFDRELARRIEFWSAEKMVGAYERKDPETPWTIVGAGTPAIQTIPNGVLLSTSRLKAEKIEIASPSSEEQRTLQLEPARRKIRVYAAEGKPLADLRLGKRFKLDEKAQSAHDHANESVFIMETSRKLVGRYSTRLDDLFPGN